MIFPSIHEFGGDVVFEPLAMGVVPVVVDFGGLGDIAHPKVGYKVPLTNEIDIVAQMEKILTELAHSRDRLEQLRRQGIAYVQERLTWDAKVQSVTRVLDWVLRRGPKPELPPPKVVAAAIGSSLQWSVATQSA
jgi:glycosyltransferase involved in cell wall biosynthesis